jgi:hypothetical protein
VRRFCASRWFINQQAIDQIGVEIGFNGTNIKPALPILYFE